MTLEPEALLAALQRHAADRKASARARHVAWLWRAAGILLVVLRDLAFGQLTLRAMSLVYTTLLSIVPLLALSFSVLKAFGVHNQIEPTLQRFLEPLGPRGEEIASQIVTFIGNMNVGVLGSLGLALLLYTAVSLIQKIEDSFNYIWHVAEPRSIGTRLSSYLSVMLVGPLLVFSALGLTAAATSIGIVRDLMAIEPFGHLAVLVGKLVPYALIIGLFFFIYLYIPNTRVRLLPALAGALFGGIAWQTAGWAFANFVVTSSNYAAIYSGFAILILFMIWIYVSWLIVLLGASVAFYAQHPEFVIARPGEPPLSGRMQERAALATMRLIAAAHLRGEPAPAVAGLARALRLPTFAIRRIIDVMTGNGLLIEIRREPHGWLPARAPATISAWDIVGAIRADGEARAFDVDRLQCGPDVAGLARAADDALRRQLAGVSLAQLAGPDDRPAPAEDDEPAAGTAASGDAPAPEGVPASEGAAAPAPARQEPRLGGYGRRPA